MRLQAVDEEARVCLREAGVVPRDAERLDRLRLAAESASGAMRQAAVDLEDIAEALPERQAARRQHLMHTARRLCAAADLLTLEVNANSPTTVGWAVRIAKAALTTAGLGLVALPVGLGEGAGAALVERALQSQARAGDCIAEVREEARAAEVDPSELDRVVESSRLELLRIINDPVFTREFDLPDRVVLIRMLEAPDLGVPNARQRIVYLKSTVDTLGALVYPVGGPGALDDAVYAVERELERVAAALSAEDD